MKLLLSKLFSITFSPVFPFNPVAKTRFFYGWVIVALATIGVIMSSPGQTNGVSAFTDYFITFSNLNRSQLSLAYFFGTVFSAFFVTYTGKLFDKFGARILISFAPLSVGIILIIGSYLPEFAKRIPVIEILNSLPVLHFLLFAVFFCLLRFSSQGLLAPISRNMTMKWFDTRRGLANVFMGMFIALGFGVIPKLFNSIMGTHGARQLWAYLGIFEIVSAILFYLFCRDNPHTFGLKPDGNLKAVKHTKIVYHPEHSFTLKEAQKTFAFAFFTIVLALDALFITAQLFHISAIFESAQLSRDIAFSIYLPAGIIGICINLLSSWLSDRVPIKYIVMVLLVGLVLSSSGQIGLSKFLEPSRFALMLGNGLSGGAFSLLITLCCPRYFGVKHLGEIVGRMMMFIIAGSAVGPYIFSLCFRISSSYIEISTIIGLFSVVLLVVAPFLPLPHNPKRTSESSVL